MDTVYFLTAEPVENDRDVRTYTSSLEPFKTSDIKAFVKRNFCNRLRSGRNGMWVRVVVTHNGGQILRKFVFCDGMKTGKLEDNF